jgi:hypothetical protein
MLGLLPILALSLAQCHSSDTGPGNDTDGGTAQGDAGASGNDLATQHHPHGDASVNGGDDASMSGGDDASMSGGDDMSMSGGDDMSSSGACSAWQVGTLTGYNNSNFADDPNAGSVMEFTGLTDAFYNNVNIAAVDSSDWPTDKYHYVDIRYNGVIGRVGVWDACSNADCPDGTQCCTDNKKLFANPGYLLDVETRTAQRLWGVMNAENVLQDKIDYRICESFDPDAIAAMYGATRSN